MPINNIENESIDYSKLDLDSILALPDFDEKEGFSVGELISDTKNNTNDILDNIDFDAIDLYINKIEKEYNVKVSIDKKNESIKLYTTTGDYIGVIQHTNYSDGTFSTSEHLCHEIEDKYKGKGLGSLIFDIYRRISIEDKNFYFPEEEYSQKASRIGFLLTRGFILTSKIINGKEEELSQNEIDLIFKTIERSKQNSSNGLLEKKLNFTYKLNYTDKTD